MQGAQRRLLQVGDPVAEGTAERSCEAEWYHCLVWLKPWGTWHALRCDDACCSNRLTAVPPVCVPCVC